MLACGKAGLEARHELLLPAVALPVRHVGAHGDAVAPGQDAQALAGLEFAHGLGQELLGGGGRGLGRLGIGGFQDREKVLRSEPAQAARQPDVRQATLRPA